MVKGKIIKLHMKGDLNHCNNWRGIILLSIPRKIFTRIIIDRKKFIHLTIIIVVILIYTQRKLHSLF